MRLTISSNKIWALVVATFLFKLIYFFYYKILITGTVFGGGNDADYYHFFAINDYQFAVNFWPVILRYLNEIGLYNRDIIATINFVLSLTLLPILYYKLVKIKTDEMTPVKAGSYFIIIFYPSIFYFTVDIYREILMFTILLLSLLLYKKIFEVNFARRNIYFLIYIALAYFAYSLRVYLGFALGLTPFVYLFLSKTKKYFKVWLAIYFLVLILINFFGGIDEILDYRENFLISASRSGATLGISLIDQNPIMFFFYYCLSIMGQLFGLYLVNLNAVLVFFLESLPFIFACVYISKNIKFMTKFAVFLLTFFVIYSTIWLLGNDNLGTAVRLRIPSYLSIFACMFIIYQTKIILAYEKLKKIN